MTGLLWGRASTVRRKKKRRVPPLSVFQAPPTPGLFSVFCPERVSRGAFAVHTPMLLQDSAFPTVRSGNEEENLREHIALTAVI